MGRLTGLKRILTVAEFVEATADSTQPGNDLVMQGVLAASSFCSSVSIRVVISVSLWLISMKS